MRASNYGPSKYIEDITRWRVDMNLMFEFVLEILFLSREHKSHIFELTCNFLFIMKTKTIQLSFGRFVHKGNRTRQEMTSSISSLVRIWKIRHYRRGCDFR